MKQLEQTRIFIFCTNDRGMNGEAKVADMLDDLNILESCYASSDDGSVQSAMNLTKNLRELLISLSADTVAIEFDEKGE